MNAFQHAGAIYAKGSAHIQALLKFIYFLKSN